jgi:hypothetical protein
MGLLHIRDDGAWDEAATLQGYPSSTLPASSPATSSPPNPATPPASPTP